MGDEKEKLTPDSILWWFGSGKINGKWRPILERQAVGRKACKKCGGFGTYGNPLCGAVYTCSSCSGTGKRPEWVMSSKRIIFYAFIMVFVVVSLILGI